MIRWCSDLYTDCSCDWMLEWMIWHYPNYWDITPKKLGYLPQLLGYLPQLLGYYHILPKKMHFCPAKIFFFGCQAANPQSNFLYTLRAPRQRWRSWHGMARIARPRKTPILSRCPTDGILRNFSLLQNVASDNWERYIVWWWQTKANHGILIGDRRSCQTCALGAWEHWQFQAVKQRMAAKVLEQKLSHPDFYKHSEINDVVSSVFFGGIHSVPNQLKTQENQEAGHSMGVPASQLFPGWQHGDVVRPGVRVFAAMSPIKSSFW